MTSATAIRPPAVAGQFYSANAGTLRRDVEEMLAEANAAAIPHEGTPIGVISPHAGLMYSGPTAAYAYHALRDRTFDTAVLIGPSHRDLLQGATVYPGSAFQTPLGDVRIDADLAQSIVTAGGHVSFADKGHRAEHALEVQLPFLQCVSPDSSIVPITMGDQSSDACHELAEVLGATLAGRNVVLVASSDLSHYHPSDIARTLDGRVIDLVRSYQPELLIRLLEEERVEACGGGPIVTVMMAARLLGATKAKILHSCNSGDVTGDTSGVVGYMSAVLTTT